MMGGVAIVCCFPIWGSLALYGTMPFVYGFGAATLIMLNGGIVNEDYLERKDLIKMYKGEKRINEEEIKKLKALKQKLLKTTYLQEKKSTKITKAINTKEIINENEEENALTK